ncbi:efflux pump antibiotic resistance [Phlyctema vagabunda]|uniref:Efflux pump antibiotic resistance n=1 Tax=Phlyctema vagabunda TaxID=108571 RepID=A0ABR4P6Z8_9HELO
MSSTAPAQVEMANSAQDEIKISRVSEDKNIAPSANHGNLRAEPAEQTPAIMVDSNNRNTYELHDLNLPEVLVDVEALPGRSKVRVVAVMAALFATLFISSLNATIVATAIPTITSDLGSGAGYAWIGGAYMLANTAAAPIWVKFSDIWGRKAILLSAVGLYFVSSIICATSTSMKMLIIGRTFQGVAGGGLIQMVFITISDLFSMRERSLYLGLLEVIWAISGGIGPVLGGVFTEYTSWRWIFWINLPISGTAFLLLFIFLDVHNPRTPFLAGLQAIDWFGSLSMLGLMSMLLLGLDFGGATFPWDSPTVICLIVFGALMSLFFIFSEKRLAKYPLMPMGIFKEKSNALISSEYYLPLFFQSALGRSPVTSGTLTVPLTVTSGLSGIVTGVVIHRTGRYLELIYIGVVFLVLGMGLYTLFSPSTSVPMIVGLEILAGLGAGFLYEPPLIALQAHVEQDNVATATSTAGFVRSVALCLGLVVGDVIFQNEIQKHAGDMQKAGLTRDLVGLLTGQEAAANVLLIKGIEDLTQRGVVQQAFATSLRGIWVTCTVMTACGVVCAAFIKKKGLSDVHVETKTGLKGDDKVALDQTQ